MKKLLFVVLTIFALSAHAELVSNDVRDAGFNKLTEVEKAEILKVVADKAAANTGSAAAALPTEAKVEKYVDLGERIGKMVGSAAREVGSAANEFVKTPVGIMTMGLIMWHYMGGMILHFTGGLLVIAITVWWFRFSIRKITRETITYNTEIKNIFGNHPIKEITRNAVDEDTLGALTFGAFCGILIGIATCFTW
jgi:hypothetical protein